MEERAPVALAYVRLARHSYRGDEACNRRTVFMAMPMRETGAYWVESSAAQTGGKSAVAFDGVHRTMVCVVSSELKE